MYTGLIDTAEEVLAFERQESGARLRVSWHASYDALTQGESIAVSGVCLTIFPDAGSFSADLSLETLGRTTLGNLKPGAVVNVERALKLGDRLGGHLVQGHVDCVGTLIEKRQGGSFAVYRWSFPHDSRHLIIDKGSITVDGVSLTVVEPDGETFGAALIPETLSRTNLGRSSPGDRVNLEFDMIAKYVAGLVTPYSRPLRD